jgi:predicted DCC family thiol-disulfide oxidoreductase YuxK
MTEFDLELFYDGECPLCSREVAWIRRLDKSNRVVLTDIAATGFDPAELGVAQADLMAKIHARLPSGELISGVEVFNRTYEALGLTRLAKIARWRGVAPLLDRAYELFAKNRLRLTGRCDAETCSTDAAPRST